MLYQEFVERIKELVHKESGCAIDRMVLYQEGFTSDDPEIKEWIKNCNHRYVGKEDAKLLTDILTIDLPEKSGRGIIQRLAIRKMYENSENNGFETVVKDICDLQKQIGQSNFDLSSIGPRETGDYMKLRNQLIVRPLNYNLHIHDLKGCVYKRVSDFALVLYQVISDTDDILATSKIKREELKHWGMEGQEEQVIQDALRNTADLFPACVYDQRTGKEENLMEKEFAKADIIMHARMDIILVSTFKVINGAVALFYPGVMEKLMRIMGGPFQAVFMNINDVMIFDEADPNAYRALQTAKRSDGEAEMLSETVFLCNEEQLASWGV